MDHMFTKSRSPLLMVLVAVCCTSSGCGGEGEEVGEPIEKLRPGNMVVYEGRGRLTCAFTGGSTPQQSAMKLANAGVDVLRSGCGGVTGVVSPAVCGFPSGEILLHEIRSVNLDTADRLGFAPADNLIDRSRGTDYVWVDCQTGATLP